MIKVCIDDLLTKHDKSVYWLAKETGITNNNLANLIKNKTSSISFEKLDKICEALNCDVGDIIKRL